MSGFLWAVAGIFGGFGLAIVGDMVSEEARDRLDHLPCVILQLAARRLDPAQRVTLYDDEWLPELTYILKGDEARPVTRLYHGIRFAVGILISAVRIARQLSRSLPALPSAKSGIWTLPASLPQHLRVPAAWWETSAVASFRLDPAPEKLMGARQFLREQLALHGLSHLWEDAEMVMAGLVDNAVREGLTAAPHLLLSGALPPALRLCVLSRKGEAMLAVTDPSGQGPVPKSPSTGAESNCGLHLVGALSYVWGWSPIEGHGRAVWAVLRG